MQIGNSFAFVLFVIAMFLVVFYFNHQDDETIINELQHTIKVLQIQVVEEQQKVTQLEAANQKLRVKYSSLQDTTTLLTKFAGEELFWQIIGPKKLKTLCSVVSIALREDIPELENLPC